jgi:1,4-alpha-glucan branching enzyme
MNNPVKPMLDKQQIAAITSAKHQDVFSVLGMHKQPASKNIIIRTFLPNAKNVEVIDDSNNVVANLTLIDKSGLFEGVVLEKGDKFSYLLRVEYQHETIVVDDPYRYPSMINNDDLYLFCEGTHEKVYEWMGAHQCEVGDVTGTHFVVWAPDASRVSVVGDFNFWDGRHHVMRKHPGAGVWEIFLPNVMANASYKYEIADQYGHTIPLKADPYAVSMQLAPETASVVAANSLYQWQDKEWMQARADSSNYYNGPVSI